MICVREKKKKDCQLFSVIGCKETKSTNSFKEEKNGHVGRKFHHVGSLSRKKSFASAAVYTTVTPLPLLQ